MNNIYFKMLLRVWLILLLPLGLYFSYTFYSANSNSVYWQNKLEQLETQSKNSTEASDKRVEPLSDEEFLYELKAIDNNYELKEQALNNITFNNAKKRKNGLKGAFLLLLPITTSLLWLIISWIWFGRFSKRSVG